MTVNLLVTQLRFTRSELIRCLEGVTEDEARKRFEPMNSISWVVGHLADQENLYWVRMAQGIKMSPDLRDLVGFGRPPSTPPLDEMWSTWREITSIADRYLDVVSTEVLETYFEMGGKPIKENVGTLLMRNIYHYWFHTGEAYAMRQFLGHRDLPDFVGNMSQAAYYFER